MGIQVLDEAWSVQQCSLTDGKLAVLVTIEGPYGTLRHILGAEAARKVGADLQRLGSTDKLALVTDTRPAYGNGNG